MSSYETPSLLDESTFANLASMWTGRPGDSIATADLAIAALLGSTAWLTSPRRT
jgi:hypothetical protein